MTHKAYSYSKRLPQVMRSEEVDGHTEYVLTLDDEFRQIGTIEEAVRIERIYAREKHRQLASWHEAYAVIREELEEFWDSVKREQPDLDELLQVAAMCQLAIRELGNSGGELPLQDTITDKRMRFARNLPWGEGRDEGYDGWAGA